MPSTHDEPPMHIVLTLQNSEGRSINIVLIKIN